MLYNEAVCFKVSLYGYDDFFKHYKRISGLALKIGEYGNKSISEQAGRFMGQYVNCLLVKGILLKTHLNEIHSRHLLTR